MEEDTTESSPACDHSPTLVSVLKTSAGYRVRCLRCGVLGPERESAGAAWDALREEQPGTRRPPFSNA